jgi:hypothetical protein
MTMFAGLDVGFKRTSVCVIDGDGRSVWRGVVDSHPKTIAAALHRWRGGLGRSDWRAGRCHHGWPVGLASWAFRLFVWTHGGRRTRSRADG